MNEQYEMNTQNSDGADGQLEAPVGPLKRNPLFVPGVMRCAKCNFALVRTNLYVQSGTTGQGHNETEPCPNGCGPLWPVTWEQEAREAYAVVERYFDEAQALRRAVQDAYGRLWCVNAEPMAPVPLYPPAAAARDARAILLAMLTKEQQAEAISKAREALGHNVGGNRLAPTQEQR